MNVCCVFKKRMPRGRCDSVLNISSGRCVLRNSRVGKSLRGRLRSCKTCLNVRTNRCVSAKHSACKRGKHSAGKRGKRSAGKRRKRSAGKRSAGKDRKYRIKALTCIPNEMYGLIEECECQKRWRKMTSIGSFGCVWKCISCMYCPYTGPASGRARINHSDSDSDSDSDSN